MHIVGHGVVKANAYVADLPQGAVTILPADGNPHPKVMLTIQGHDMVEANVAGKKPASLDWNFRTRAQGLSKVLQRAGYTDLNADEVEASPHIIEGATTGPRVTPMPGQTEFLETTSVEFE